MKKFDAIIIGFGKAGKTLGGMLGAQGKQGRVNVTDPKREAVRNLFGHKE